VSLEERLTNLALGGATWVLWLLMALSVVSLAIILERALFFATSRDDVPALTRRLVQRLARGERGEAERELEASPCIEARVAKVVLAGSFAGAEARLRSETGLARLRMERSVSFLGTLGTNAPFVGLLGTVIGIIGAFHQLDASGGRLSAGLMAEIGEALVVTGLGLVVALPAVVAFNVLQRVIQVRLDRSAALAQVLLATLEGREAPPSSRRQEEG
jgi:biopolymer transport protein ExbB